MFVLVEITRSYLGHLFASLSAKLVQRKWHENTVTGKQLSFTRFQCAICVSCLVMNLFLNFLVWFSSFAVLASLTGLNINKTLPKMGSRQNDKMSQRSIPRLWGNPSSGRRQTWLFPMFRRWPLTGGPCWLTLDFPACPIIVARYRSTVGAGSPLKSDILDSLKYIRKVPRCCWRGTFSGRSCQSECTVSKINKIVRESIWAIDRLLRKRHSRGWSYEAPRASPLQEQ